MISKIWRKSTLWFGHFLPKRLYTRSLIIIIAPMVLLQSVIAYVFMERHWQMVTERLSMAVVHNIAAVIDIIERYPAEEYYNEIISIAHRRLGLDISFLPPNPLPSAEPRSFFDTLDNFLSGEITKQIKHPFWIDTVADSNLIEIQIKLENGILHVFAPRSQTYASNTKIFLSWMIGTALVLLAIAIFFLRKQITPIQQLAEAAESFGKGQPFPKDFEPRGADEIKRAGIAFLRMRTRIERQIEQRTAMLSGVSHDLRTILTRFKLQLALTERNFDRTALERDIADMQNMLEEYLAFARGEGTEEREELDIRKLMQKFSEEAQLHECNFICSIQGEPLVRVRPGAFERLVGNLISNSFRCAEKIFVTMQREKNLVRIIIDDDGPGIPEEKREDVFKPFFRLDNARNQDSGGTGLGLSIARDIARSHGGDVKLNKSPQGGLRAIIEIAA